MLQPRYPSREARPCFSFLFFFSFFSFPVFSSSILIVLYLIRNTLHYTLLYFFQPPSHKQHPGPLFCAQDPMYIFGGETVPVRGSCPEVPPPSLLLQHSHVPMALFLA